MVRTHTVFGQRERALIPLLLNHGTILVRITRLKIIMQEGMPCQIHGYLFRSQHLSSRLFRYIHCPADQSRHRFCKSPTVRLLALSQSESSRDQIIVGGSKKGQLGRTSATSKAEMALPATPPFCFPWVRLVLDLLISLLYFSGTGALRAFNLRRRSSRNYQADSSSFCGADRAIVASMCTYESTVTTIDDPFTIPFEYLTLSHQQGSRILYAIAIQDVAPNHPLQR